MTDVINLSSPGMSKLSRAVSDFSLSVDVCHSTDSCKVNYIKFPSLVDLLVELLTYKLDEFKNMDDVPYNLLELIGSQMASKTRFDDDNVCLFRALQKLNLSHSRITDTGVNALLLTAYDNCVYLDLTSTAISDCSLRMIAKNLPNLLHLNVSRCEIITDYGVREIVQGCIKLKFFGLCHLPLLTKNSIEMVTKLPNLQYLDFSQCSQITCSQLQCHQCFSLKTLSISHSFLSQNSMLNLISSCLNIKHLSLDYCYFIDTVMLDGILSCLTNLESISLIRNTSLKEDGLKLISKHKKINRVCISENSQIELSLIRELASQTRIKFCGSQIQIHFMRDRSSRQTFTHSFDEFEPFSEVRKRVEETVACENQQNCVNGAASKFELLRITYRKNGTKRPGFIIPADADNKLVREVVDKKRHIYVFQHEQHSLVDEQSALFNQNVYSPRNLFLILKIWNQETREPEILRDVWIPSDFTLGNFKQYLSSQNIVPFEPEKILFIEEETQMRINLLLLDNMPLSVYGIIYGDILHIEELDHNFHYNSSGDIYRSHTQEYFRENSFKIAVHETDESFLLRQHYLGEYFSPSAFKFELDVRHDWTFLELRRKISQIVGMDFEYLHLSTRVEPFVQLKGNEFPICQVLSGNLWLLLDINSKDMISEKTNVNLFLNSIKCPLESYSLNVRKNASLHVVREKIVSLLGIPESQQLISRVSKKEKSLFREGRTPLLKSFLTNFEQTVSQASLKTIRLDTVYKPFDSGDIVLQVLKFSSWTKMAFYSCLKWDNNVIFLSMPRSFMMCDLYQALRCLVDSNCEDFKVAKIVGANGNRIYRENFLEIKEDQTVEEGFWKSLDVICWGF